MARKIGRAVTNLACKELTVSATVIRADGTREDLGVVAHTRFGAMARTGKRIRNWLANLKR